MKLEEGDIVIITKDLSGHSFPEGSEVVIRSVEHIGTPDTLRLTGFLKGDEDEDYWFFTADECIALNGTTSTNASYKFLLE